MPDTCENCQNNCKYERNYLAAQQAARMLAALPKPNHPEGADMYEDCLVGLTAEKQKSLQEGWENHCAWVTKLAEG